MFSVEKCKKYLKEKNLNEERIIAIRDFLYAICKETIENNLNEYESSVKNNSKKDE